MNDQHHVFDTSVQYRSLLHSSSGCDYTLRRERPYAQAGAFFFCRSTRYAIYPGLLLSVLLFTSRPPPWHTGIKNDEGPLLFCCEQHVYSFAIGKSSIVCTLKGKRKMAICLETREKTYEVSTEFDSTPYKCIVTDQKEYDSHTIVCDVCDVVPVYPQDLLDLGSLTMRVDVHERNSDWSVLSCGGSISPITPAGYSVPDRTIWLSKDLSWNKKRFVVAIGMALYCAFAPGEHSEDQLADWMNDWSRFWSQCTPGKLGEPFKAKSIGVTIS